MDFPCGNRPVHEGNCSTSDNHILLFTLPMAVPSLLQLSYALASVLAHFGSLKKFDSVPASSGKS